MNFNARSYFTWQDVCCSNSDQYLTYQKLLTNQVAVRHRASNRQTRTDRSWRSEGPLHICWRPTGTFWFVFLTQGHSVWHPWRCERFSWHPFDDSQSPMAAECRWGHFGVALCSWVAVILHCSLRCHRLCTLLYRSTVSLFTLLGDIPIILRTSGHRFDDVVTTRQFILEIPQIFTERRIWKPMAMDENDAVCGKVDLYSCRRSRASCRRRWAQQVVKQVTNRCSDWERQDCPLSDACKGFLPFPRSIHWCTKYQIGCSCGTCESRQGHQVP